MDFSSFAAKITPPDDKTCRPEKYPKSGKIHGRMTINILAETGNFI